MNKIKNLFLKNELFIRLAINLIFCIVIASFLTALVSYNQAKNSYISSYEKSNAILMTKIQDDYQTLNENTNRIFNSLDNSLTVENYLKDTNGDSQLSIDLQNEMKNTRFLFEDIPSNLILLGTNGTTYFQNSGVRNVEIDQVLSSELFVKINKDPTIEQTHSLQTGFSISTKDKPGLLLVRKLISHYKIYGYALIYIPEKYFSSIYQSVFDKQLHEILVVNENNQIVSSNNKKELGKTNPYSKKDLERKRMTTIQLYPYHLKMINILNEKALVSNMALIQPILLIVFFSILIVSISAFLILKKMTQPIYRLTNALSKIQDGDFDHPIELEGTHEIQQLGSAYNSMLKELQHYFDDLITTEQEKRLAEIRSLQMQIQPHFIYNTLTSIKFLIWQKEPEVATNAIDNFILLLRHTLRDANELVSLEEEIASTKAYVEILKLRYGDSIQVSFLFSEKTSDYLVPKMLVQPIIENAYLHAFPDKKTGFIQVFSRSNEKTLYIEVMDNGIGIDTMDKMNFPKKVGYTGVGLKNIHERLQLMYGKEYGISVSSVLGEGTQVKLTLPVNKKIPADDENFFNKE